MRGRGDQRRPRAGLRRRRIAGTGSSGKGNKLIQIPPAKLKSGEERVIHLAIVQQGGELVLSCGQRKLTLAGRDLQAYSGHRASRGNPLPRGFQRVDSVVSA
jgi:topoisomerase-4 subunit A